MSEWIGIAGCQSERVATIKVCGGCAEWWNYYLVFKDDDDYDLFLEDKYGRHPKLSTKLIYHIDHEEVKEVDDNDEYEVKEDEILIDYEFFCWN